MDVLTEEQLSDDEIFVGKFSLKEVKKCVLWNKQRDRNRELDSGGIDRSLRIIETHSAPDVLLRETKPIETSQQLKSISNPVLSPLSSPNKWDKATDDSFLKIEKMVTDLCVSQENSSVVLDNTLEVIDYILKNGPAQNYADPNIKSKEIPETNVCIDNKFVIPKITVTEPDTEKYSIKTQNSEKVKNTLFTPSKTNVSCKKADFSTPCSNMNSNFKTPMFKTPVNPASSKKTPHSLLKKSLPKASYKNVASPVASYINNCPKVPLIKDVRPSKPLPGHSAIPKFVKSTQCKPSNKENVKLPTVAYKSAKKTEVIDIPDKEKLPQSQWVKKLTSSLPRPLVMKHDHRETNIAKRMFMSKYDDSSFADLSLQQADVSVCTQKSAFNRLKKH